LARSRGERRSAAPPESSDPSSSVPSLASSTLPRVWQGVGYRPLPDVAAARRLFDFAAVPWPHDDALALAWGAFASGGDGLVGAVVGERAERAMMLHGPVIEASASDPLEIAGQLLAAALDHATALGVETVFTRPQGLDRVWVRFGFIPVPESALPQALRGRAGAGLYAWRGGSALWTFREER
jgi:hypothetical protein